MAERVLYTDIDPYCCAVLGSRVEDGSLPPGDVLLADVRDLTADHLCCYHHVHLFAGIGGSPLGFAWASEGIDLEQTPSLLTGGFPCQDISAAGRGAGIHGERSGLFWELARLAGARPFDLLWVENVGALSCRGLDVVAAALGEAGYFVPEAYRLGAWALGAPHERERWWIVGYGRAFADAHQDEIRQQRERARRGGPETAGEVADASAGGGAGNKQAGHRLQRRRARDAEQAGVGNRPVDDAAGAGHQEPAPAATEEGPADARRDAGQLPGGSVRSGWGDPVTGPWRRIRDEWQYAGPPVFVYRHGAEHPQRQEQPARPQHSPAERAGGPRPDPTLERGWPVPVLPGYAQHPWEFARLHQRGVGDAVHGLSGRMADSLNRSGVMALGNAQVPQVVAALARGLIAQSENSGRRRGSPIGGGVGEAATS